MKLPQSNTTMKAPRSLFVAGVFGLLALANSAQAVVTVTFAQSGPNVTATLSGSLLLPLIGDRANDDVSNPVTTLSGGQFELYALVNPNAHDMYSSGTFNFTGLSPSPDSFSGPTTFGYNANLLFVDGSALPGGILTPTGTWTWNNTTLAGIGLGSLTTTPMIVYRAAPSSDDTIQFVAAVPEPSSSVLIGLGASALLFRRRRLA